MPKPIHGSGGYNIKVRRVSNGFTIHYTEIMEDGREEHKNLIAWDAEMVMMESLRLQRDWSDRNPDPELTGPAVPVTTTPPGAPDKE